LLLEFHQFHHLRQCHPTTPRRMSSFSLPTLLPDHRPVTFPPTCASLAFRFAALHLVVRKGQGPHDGVRGGE
jgi:hypothetical protein